MIDTVTNIFGKGCGTTYLVIDKCRLTTYLSGGGQHAEAKFLGANRANLHSFPDLWMNNSPCPACAKKLIAAYRTIHSAHFYRGGIDKEIVLQCLAKMVASKINLEAFDWK